MKDLVIEFLKEKRLEFKTVNVIVTTNFSVIFTDVLKWDSHFNVTNPFSVSLRVTEDYIRFNDVSYAIDEMEDFKEDFDYYTDKWISEINNRNSYVLRLEKILQYAQSLKDSNTSYTKLTALDFNSTEYYYLDLITEDEDGYEVERDYIALEKLSSVNYPVKENYNLIGAISQPNTTKNKLSIESIYDITRYVSDITEKDEDKHDLEIYLQ